MDKISEQKKFENIVFRPELPYFCHMFPLKLSPFNAECNFASNTGIGNNSDDVLKKIVRKVKLTKTFKIRHH